MKKTHIAPEEAIQIVLDSAPVYTLENVQLAEALGRVLPESIPALLDQPPFSKSAMDGFAYEPDDLPENGSFQGNTGIWRVVHTISAGINPEIIIKKGECIRIMTGAPIPSEKFVVHRKEWTTPAGFDADGTEFVNFNQPETNTNVIYRSENQRFGDLLLEPRILKAQDIGILASSGYCCIEVAKRPIVGVLSTGNEIIPAGSTLKPAMIFDSNGPQIAAQTKATGCLVHNYGICLDDFSSLCNTVTQMLDECDVIIISGGV